MPPPRLYTFKVEFSLEVSSRPMRMMMSVNVMPCDVCQSLLRFP